MKSNSIINLLPNITYNNTSCLNIFSKYKILEKIKGDVSANLDYIVRENDRWDIISFRFYGTTDLWWIIASFNDIKNPFQELQVNTTLKIIKPEYIPNLLLEIKRVTRQ